MDSSQGGHLFLLGRLAAQKDGHVPPGLGGQAGASEGGGGRHRRSHCAR